MTQRHIAHLPRPVQNCSLSINHSNLKLERLFDQEAKSSLHFFELITDLTIRFKLQLLHLKKGQILMYISILSQM